MKKLQKKPQKKPTMKTTSKTRENVSTHDLQIKLDMIEQISRSLGKIYKFDMWDQDDIAQELYFLVEEAEPQYDEAKGDRYNFYFNYCKNRLSNFKRDNYGGKRKRGILDAQTLTEETLEIEREDFSAYQKLIDERVDASLRADYLRFCQGVKLPHKRKKVVMTHIEEIVGRIQKNSEIVNGELVEGSVNG